MWQPKTWPVFGEKLDQAGIVGEHIHGPFLDLGEHPFVEVVDLVVVSAAALASGDAPGSIKPAPALLI